MSVLFANRARSTLAGPITNVAVTLNVASGEGALFPSPTGGDFFPITLSDGTLSGANEICYCTGRSGDTLTVTRAQEGTTALAWTGGSRADNLATAGTMAVIQAAASGQSQSGNYAPDTGTANALVITLSPAPGSFGILVGAPIRVLKSAAANNGNVTIDVNSLGPTSILHADGSQIASGELPANGLFEINYDGSTFVLVSMTHEAATPTEMEAGTDTVKQATPSNFPYHSSAVKAWVKFHWNGAAVVVDHAYNVSGVTRSATGHFVATLSGGFDFTFGIAVVSGNGPNPATAGSIGMGSSFTGVNPAVDVYTGDAGGSGGQASDPAGGAFVIFVGETSN